jgi:orotate phosphoribosyltransferase
MSDLVQALARIGAIQFGQFEAEPGIFDPVSIHLRLLPSYPSTLRALAEEIAPMVRIDGLTHLLPTPSALPVGVAISLTTDLPLVYPAAGDPQTIDGAYDFNVPTILLTDVLTDGAAESALIKRARPLGLDVKAIVAILSIDTTGLHSVDGLPIRVWRQLDQLLVEITPPTPSMRSAVHDWLKQKRRAG